MVVVRGPCSWAFKFAGGRSTVLAETAVELPLVSGTSFDKS